MISKTNRRILMAIGIIILVLLIRRETYIPQNQIINNSNLENIIEQEYLSCLSDCTYGDGNFREECIGFNGCFDSPYLKDKQFCRTDSDCVENKGCCTSSCTNTSCETASFCEITNEVYKINHDKSCNRNIRCFATRQCLDDYETRCVQNTCRIINK